jgi:glycosyltransferase involved in cell wall biosynthesis
MDIAILGTRGIPAQYGGFETFAEELAVRLVERKVSVTIYGIAGGIDQVRSYKGVRLVHISSPRLGPLTTVLFDLRCLWHARGRYDIVYMLGYGSSPGAVIPRLWGTRMWINMDGVEWARAKWGRIAKAYFKATEAIAMRAADRIIADAENIKELLYRRHPVSTPCSVIPYGATVVESAPRTSYLEELGLRSAGYYLIVCRLEPENHIWDILSGFAASTSRSPLIVIGDHGIGTKYVRRLLKIRDDRIRFLGTIYDQGRLQAIRYHCRAYFHGHSVGGTNPSLLEALGCGNIVVAHDNGFNREVAADAATYFAASSDIPAIIDKIEQYDGVQRAAAAARARKRIQDSYTWERVTKAYIDIMQE